MACCSQSGQHDHIGVHMKNIHSTKWKSSAQPRKQRKYVHNLPLHLEGIRLHAHLSKDLRAKHGTRSARIRSGDTVRVLRGTHKGKEGKVERVNTETGQVTIEKVEVTKLAGGTATYPIRASNCLIIALANEKRRFKSEKDGKGSPQKD